MSGCKNVLIVEDNRVFAEVVKVSLEHAGMEAVIADHGLEAWDLLEAGRFDLVVTDDRMPLMSGAQLCQRLQQHARYADLPIIMISAQRESWEAEQLRATLGLSELIIKPASLRQLTWTIESVIATAEARRAAAAAAYVDPLAHASLVVG